MKIIDGRHVYSRDTNIQQLVDGKNEIIDELQKRLDVIALWADKQTDLHIPYVSGRVDLSCADPAKRKEIFLNQIGRNLWCSECSTTWPCSSIDLMKQLRRFAQGRLEESDKEEFEQKIQSIMPKERAGQLGVSEFFL